MGVATAASAFFKTESSRASSGTGSCASDAARVWIVSLEHTVKCVRYFGRTHNKVSRHMVVRAYPHARASFANRATSFTRFARIARIDSNARVTDTATRSTHARRPGTRASTRVASRVGANAVRTRTFPRQPVRGDGVRHGSPTHQVGGAGRGPRRYVVAASRRARREGSGPLETPGRPNPPSAPSASTTEASFSVNAFTDRPRIRARR